MSENRIVADCLKVVRASGGLLGVFITRWMEATLAFDSAVRMGSSILRTVGSVVGVLSLLACISGASPEITSRNLQPNHVYTMLQKEGVRAEGEAFLLPTPLMPDGLAADKQTAILQELCKRIPFEKFIAANVNAPDITPHYEDLKKSSSGAIRKVDNFFVAYGDPRLLQDEEFLKSLQSEGDEGNATGKLLSENDLQSRGLAPVVEKQETVAHGEFTLIEKLRLSAAFRAMWSASDESLTAAGCVDERFDKDAEFPNRWIPLKKLESGKLQEGESQPYSGAGFYTKITQLKDPQGAFFVETHLVLYEPKGWFEGAPLLTSKFAIIASNRAKEVRRKLLKASERLKSEKP